MSRAKTRKPNFSSCWGPNDDTSVVAQKGGLGHKPQFNQAWLPRLLWLLWVLWLLAQPRPSGSSWWDGVGTSCRESRARPRESRARAKGARGLRTTPPVHRNLTHLQDNITEENINLSQL